jgi:putative ABC transport system ATP-binding protein
MKTILDVRNLCKSFADTRVLNNINFKVDEGQFIAIMGQVNQSAYALMVKTGIDSVADHDIKKVSGGQLQRAAICRALINKPDVLFGDEPTGALNSSTAREVMDLINMVNAEGTTVIMVTHDGKVAARAGRVIYLMDGNIHAELTLGRYSQDEKEKSNREKRLSEWLEKQGF